MDQVGRKPSGIVLGGGWHLAEVLRDLFDVVGPDVERVVLVVDSPDIYHLACLHERFELAQARRIAAKIAWHRTPEHGSWLSIAECELSVIKRQCLKGCLPTIEAVEQEVSAWQECRNQAQIGVDWRFTTEMRVSS